MEISEVTVRLLLLFFPGLIATALVHALTSQRERSAPEVLAYAFGFGLLDYLLLAASAGIVNAVAEQCCGREEFIGVRFFDVLTNEAIAISWEEILAAAVLAVPLGYAASAVHNWKWIWRVGARIGVTRKFGHLDVWEHFFDSPDVQWVVVRDMPNDLVYNGWVGAFSDTSDQPELLLRDVIVSRNSTGEELYRVGGIYVARERDSLLIELPTGGYEAAHTGEELNGEQK